MWAFERRNAGFPSETTPPLKVRKPWKRQIDKRSLAFYAKIIEHRFFEAACRNRLTASRRGGGAEATGCLMESVQTRQPRGRQAPTTAVTSLRPITPPWSTPSWRSSQTSTASWIGCLWPKRECIRMCFIWLVEEC